MKRFYMIYPVCIFLMIMLTSISTGAQPLEEIARDKIDTLKTLITEAEHAGIDALKEKMTVRTAEIFLKNANWDENHVAENTDYFELVAIYKDTAAQTAAMLPDLERREVIAMLDEAIAYITQLIDGVIFRKPIPDVDWAKVTHDGDQLTFNGRPVFLADYTWKPETEELTEFHGDQDGFFIMPPHVINVNGDINSNIINQLNNKPDGTMGFIFLNHKNTPDWAEAEYGPGFRMREDTYTAYDIDNPGAREMQGFLLGGTVPIMAGKKYTELGYMLCNEPHFYTTEGVWATGPVSEYTKEKFREWLRNKHASISDLNGLWGTSFSGFNNVTITIPIAQSLQGTPKWYDWVTFNMYRVTQWYSFLKDEIRSHDANAKVHLKIMPNLWSENKRNHGIDMEALTKLSEIIGNDAGAHNSKMWGGPEEWEERYCFSWRELCMSYDFYKSVDPDKINYNTELHFLSTVHFRDLYLDPAYARATFWLAHTLGLNASQIWYWARLEDGSIKSNAGNGYGGSNNQQPRIVNEVASTMMDLNSFSEEITAMQQQKKPLRIFYSKTSAINKEEHMDDVFELYESLFFEGIPIGFATEKIINEQDNANWEAILVHKTEFVTQAELNSLQTYLDNGGTAIIDAVSLKKSEYGDSHPGLNQSNGTLIDANSLTEMKNKAMEIIADAGLMPEVSVTEANSVGSKGCVWRCIINDEGNNVLSVVNIGKSDATLQIELNGAMNTVCKALITGIRVSSTPVLKPNEVYFVEVTDDNTGIITDYPDINTDNSDETPSPEIKAVSHPIPSAENRGGSSITKVTPKDSASAPDVYGRFVYVPFYNDSKQSQKIDNKDTYNIEKGNIQAKPDQYAYREPTPLGTSLAEQSTIKQGTGVGPIVLFETDVLDESLLDSTITNDALLSNKSIEKESKKSRQVIHLDSKKLKKSPIIGIITATLLASFGALIMIKDQ